jgi:type 1 fimbriae regulatory protein FimB/type 1 fimbriae regulatory protein FimE
VPAPDLSKELSTFMTYKCLAINLHVWYTLEYVSIERGEVMTTPSQTSKICKFIKPRRTKTNKQLRDREYLTEQEIDSLIKAIRKHSRNSLRDETIVTTMFRHGLRVREVINLKWEQIDFKEGLLHVARIKNGKDSVHPIPGVELRLLRRLEREPNRQRHLFLSERKSPITNTVINRMVQHAGERAGIEFPVHPHMLRHACGFYLANKGTDLRTIQMYLGHANIANTVIYTQLSSGKFNGLWKD